MNKMKIAVLSLFAALALAFSVTAEAQTTLTQTTFAAAVTASANTVRVASATGIVAGNLLFVEDGTGGDAGSSESMFVESVSGTVLTVVRGYYGSIANAHISGTVVITGTPNQFFAVEPSGACTPSAQPVTPYINVKTGNQWLCSSVLNRWVPGWNNTSAGAGVTAAVASAAGQITPSGPYFHITGALAITGFLLPVGFSDGCFTVINDGAYTWTAANNIALASAASQVVGQTNTFCYDRNTSKFYPAHQ